jgi:hypothetical protein
MKMMAPFRPDDVDSDDRNQDDGDDEDDSNQDDGDDEDDRNQDDDDDDDSDQDDDDDGDEDDSDQDDDDDSDDSNQDDDDVIVIRMMVMMMLIVIRMMMKKVIRMMMMMMMMMVVIKIMIVMIIVTIKNIFYITRTVTNTHRSVLKSAYIIYHSPSLEIFSFARSKQSLTSFAPSPIYICTSCGPASFMNTASVFFAQARARRVFPVPGGPYSSTPLGARIPIYTVMHYIRMEVSG